MFEALKIVNSGMQLHQAWMDAISDNVSNINTVRPTTQSAFQARYVVAQEADVERLFGGEHRLVAEQHVKELQVFDMTSEHDQAHRQWRRQQEPDGTP